jgi:hypothetical protein
VIQLRLAGKAGYHVRTQPERSHALGDFQNSTSIRFRRVPPPHPVKDSVTPTLQWNVQMGRQCPARRHQQTNERIIDFRGLDRTKAQADSRNSVKNRRTER